tara:strand:+ start:1987 stop:2322 length:336 start_codon:yes stop_codon:yes gene_type:complete
MITVGAEVVIVGNNRTEDKLINLRGRVMNCSKLGGWVKLYIATKRSFINIQQNALRLIVKQHVEFKISSRSAFKKYIKKYEYLTTIPNSSTLDYPKNQHIFSFQIKYNILK